MRAHIVDIGEQITMLCETDAVHHPDWTMCMQNTPVLPG